jgi:NhaP-type Na+/H+ and K+/H+ antiporter
LFSAYPGGLAGIGLLLLRSVIGFTAAWQGVLCLATRDAGATVRIVGGLAVLTGILLATGVRTRLASFLIALGIAFLSLCTLPPPTRDLFDRLLPGLFAETMSMAVVFLGPGAFSIDAYLYGRKEIIIPHRLHE